MFQTPYWKVHYFFNVQFTQSIYFSFGIIYLHVFMFKCIFCVKDVFFRSKHFNRWLHVDIHYMEKKISTWGWTVGYNSQPVLIIWLYVVLCFSYLEAVIACERAYLVKTNYLQKHRQYMGTQSISKYIIYMY